MNPRPVKVIRKALLNKGFEEKEGSKHTLYVLIVNGRKSAVFTRLSRGETEANSWLQDKMADQLHLSNKEFSDLVNCPLGYDQYLNLLREQDVKV
jgi:hypothetical protein